MVSVTNDVKRLRMILSAILLTLLIPTAFMVAQGLQQLERVAYFRQRASAEELVNRTDQQLARWVDQEDARSFADYGFLVVAGNNFVQPSPLAKFPVAGSIAGLVSYFQLDPGGSFTTPLIPGADVDPKTYGITEPELAERRILENHVKALLSQPQRESGAKLDLDGLVSAQEDLQEADRYAYPGAFEAKESSAIQGQRSLDRLDESAQSKLTSSLGRVEDLRLEEPYDVKAEGSAARQQVFAKPAAEAVTQSPTGSDEVAGFPAANKPAFRDTRARQKRTEQNLAPVQSQLQTTPSPVVRLEQFSSEVEPFRFTLLDDTHFALYRTAWREQTRYTQGMIIERESFVRSSIAAAFLSSRLADSIDLTVAFQGELLWSHNATSGTGQQTPTADISPILLYRDRLAAPFSEVELILSASNIPVDAGNAIVTWAGVALVVLLIGGFTLVYRLGLQQINLNQQQQDFVSAVSHELKTPLTSIRMYGEILKAGWASEEKKRTYYDFIYQESERLSRLINNVLQLARLTRNDSQLNLQALTMHELMDLVRSKISTQLDHANFQLVEDHQADHAKLLVDTDAFTQVMINLVDNAIKFSADTDARRIDLSSHLREDSVELRLRDYGPGIPKDQLKKIFQLFYRTERELTRETVGTGIGLALVNELVTSMHGCIDVQNTDPGVEFHLRFPRQHD